jgi:hypothetical protein
MKRFLISGILFGAMPFQALAQDPCTGYSMAAQNAMEDDQLTAHKLQSLEKKLLFLHAEQKKASASSKKIKTAQYRAFMGNKFCPLIQERIKLKQEAIKANLAAESCFLFTYGESSEKANQLRAALLASLRKSLGDLVRGDAELCSP